MKVFSQTPLLHMNRRHVAMQTYRATREQIDGCVLDRCRHSAGADTDIADTVHLSLSLSLEMMRAV